MQAMNSPGAPGTAEAPPGTEGLVHNKAVEPPPESGFTYLTCRNWLCIGKTAAFCAADPAPPALLLASSISFPDWIFLTAASAFRSCCCSVKQRLLNCQEHFWLRLEQLSIFFPSNWGVCIIPFLYQSLFSDAWIVCMAFLSWTLVTFLILDTEAANNIHSNNFNSNVKMLPCFGLIFSCYIFKEDFGCFQHAIEMRAHVESVTWNHSWAAFCHSFPSPILEIQAAIFVPSCLCLHAPILKCF